MALFCQMDVVEFRGKKFKVVLTDHAKLQMSLREISMDLLLHVLESGEVKEKKAAGRYWVFKKIRGRRDNLICASVAIENPHLIVITTLVNWRPK